MAQDYVGSNNLNLLVPSGQFGTRIAGGKDAASPRYIFTHLSKVARILFPEIDDELLTYNEDDGQSIEPFYYCPIIPLLVVNGSQGIGTGWSTNIPSFNIHDVVQYIYCKLNEDSDLPSISPWVKGFTGSLELNGSSGYKSIGKAKKASSTSVIVSELPVGKWTNDYKEHLLKMRSRGEIQSFTENHTTTKVSFTIQTNRAQLQRWRKSGLTKALKLETNVPTSNMNAFDENGVICKFDCPESIVDAYYPIRLGLYHDRKSLLECTREHSAITSRNKAKFIEAVVDGKIDLARGTRSKDDTVLLLEELEFTPMSKLQEIQSSWGNKKGLQVDRTITDNSVFDEVNSINHQKEFDYLLNMPLSSLTSEKISDLRNEANKMDSELDEVRQTSAEDLWRQDLEKLENYLKAQSY